MIIYCKITVKVSQDPEDLFKMLITVIMVLSSSWYDWFSNLERKCPEGARSLSRTTVIGRFIRFQQSF